MKEIPVLSFDLINQLIKDESDLNITPTMGIAVIMYKAGRRSVLDELKVRLEYFEKHKPNVTTMEINV